MTDSEMIDKLKILIEHFVSAETLKPFGYSYDIRPNQEIFLDQLLYIVRDRYEPEVISTTDCVANTGSEMWKDEY